MRTTLSITAIAIAILFGSSLIWMVTAGTRAIGPGPAGAKPVQGGAEAVGRKIGRTTAVPKIMLDELEHDLGTVDSWRECQHVFVIRNEGQAPLRLRRGSTTCKCTMSELPRRPIPPGGRAGIRVSAKVTADQTDFFSDDKPGVFSYGATIFTNDPQKPAITLGIRGVVRTPLGAHPPQILFPQLGRDESRSESVVVFSQGWNAFTIDRVRTSLDGLTWQIVPADEASLRKFGACSGYRLEVTTPPNLPGGRFREWLQISVVPADRSFSPRSLKLEIFGDVARSVSVYGRNLHGGKVLRMGLVRAGHRTRERLIMKVRDDHPVVTIRRIETRPDFLRIKVTPCSPAAEENGLYKIDVEIPAHAPVVNFMGVNRGEIRIETDHPKLPVIALDVEFAVME